jgi:hypothetical protein
MNEVERELRAEVIRQARQTVERLADLQVGAPSNVVYIEDAMTKWRAGGGCTGRKVRARKARAHGQSDRSAIVRANVEYDFGRNG